ncbi:YciI family protein [Cyclobacterium xiamenense]|uniref:YciI family protein n=1 Tax=Cyclobacterium xiamenense TaxID=1297121 RepID=UPI0035CF0188
MKNSKEFMLLFRYEPSNEEPTQEQLQEMEKHWGEFIGGIAMQGNLVSTHQLGFEGKRISPDLTTEDGFHISDSQIIGGNMVLKAESIESATELAKKCPILFMGGTVEVRDVIPMN